MRVRRSFHLAAACAASVVAAGPSLVRADKNWKTSVTNGSWNNSSNWVEGAVPNSGDNVNIYFNDSLSHVITFDTVYANNLAFNVRNTGTGTVSFNLAAPYSLQVGWASLGTN